MKNKLLTLLASLMVVSTAAGLASCSWWGSASSDPGTNGGSSATPPGSSPEQPVEPEHDDDLSTKFAFLDRFDASRNNYWDGYADIVSCEVQTTVTNDSLEAAKLSFDTSKFTAKQIEAGNAGWNGWNGELTWVTYQASFDMATNLSDMMIEFDAKFENSAITFKIVSADSSSREIVLTAASDNYYTVTALENGWYNYSIVASDIIPDGGEATLEAATGIVVCVHNSAIAMDTNEQSTFDKPSTVYIDNVEISEAPVTYDKVICGFNNEALSAGITVVDEEGNEVAKNDLGYVFKKVAENDTIKFKVNLADEIANNIVSVYDFGLPVKVDEDGYYTVEVIDGEKINVAALTIEEAIFDEGVYSDYVGFLGSVEIDAETGKIKGLASSAELTPAFIQTALKQGYTHVILNVTAEKVEEQHTLHHISMITKTKMNDWTHYWRDPQFMGASYPIDLTAFSDAAYAQDSLVFNPKLTDGTCVNAMVELYNFKFIKSAHTTEWRKSPQTYGRLTGLFVAEDEDGNIYIDNRTCGTMAGVVIPTEYFKYELDHNAALNFRVSYVETNDTNVAEELVGPYDAKSGLGLYTGAASADASAEEAWSDIAWYHGVNHLSENIKDTNNAWITKSTDLVQIKAEGKVGLKVATEEEGFYVLNKAELIVSNPGDQMSWIETTDNGSYNVWTKNGASGMDYYLDVKGASKVTVTLASDVAVEEGVLWYGNGADGENLTAVVWTEVDGKYVATFTYEGDMSAHGLKIVRTSVINCFNLSYVVE